MDDFDLDRFVSAQAGMFETAIGELRRGAKRTHWMWFIFPQISGLGHSPMARHYAIRSIDEARAYLAHPLLGPRLRASVDALAALPPGSRIESVLGGIDAMKLRSSLTLFGRAVPDETIFSSAIGRWFAGQEDDLTLRVICDSVNKQEGLGEA